MDTIRVIIVDDEPPARRGIRKELGRFPKAEVIGEASNGEEAVELIQQAKPDLVFLDIQMPFLNGLELINQIGPEQFPAVVFVTAYDQYAIDAFNVHAVDYLLKPIDSERFKKAYERVEKRIRLGEISEKEQKIDSLVRYFRENLDSGKEDTRNRLVIQDAGKAFFLDYQEIVWIEASGNYLNIHTKGKSQPILIRETLKNMEERLQNRSFLRVHRSKVVNLDNVREMEQQSDGRYTLKLSTGDTLNSSRRYKQRVAKVLSRLS